MLRTTVALLSCIFSFLVFDGEGIRARGADGGPAIAVDFAHYRSSQNLDIAIVFYPLLRVEL